MNRADFLKTMVAAGLVPTALRDRLSESVVPRSMPEAADTLDPEAWGITGLTLVVGGHEVQALSVDFVTEAVDGTTALDGGVASYKPGRTTLGVEAFGSVRLDAALDRMYMDGDPVDVSVRLGPETMAFDAFVTGYERHTGWGEEMTTVYFDLEPAGPVTMS